MQHVYTFQTLSKGALWLPLAILITIFGAAIYVDRAASGWLLAMSFAVIAITGQSYADAIHRLRFWITILIYCALHLVTLSYSTKTWIPKPTSAITPFFILDYLAMGWAFPKISGLRFK